MKNLLLCATLLLHGTYIFTASRPEQPASCPSRLEALRQEIERRKKQESAIIEAAQKHDREQQAAEDRERIERAKIERDHREQKVLERALAIYNNQKVLPGTYKWLSIDAAKQRALVEIKAEEMRESEE